MRILEKGKEKTMQKDHYLKEYRCGPCKTTEILTDQSLGSPADGQKCTKCATRMLLIRIQPMGCVTTWEFTGSRLEKKPQKGDFNSLWELGAQAMKGISFIRAENAMPITQQTQERIVSDVKVGKLSYKPVPCSNCGIELSIESFMRNEGLGNDGSPEKPRYCDVCDSIVKSVATCPGLIEAHEKYETDQFRKRGLIEGR